MPPSRTWISSAQAAGGRASIRSRRARSISSEVTGGRLVRLGDRLAVLKQLMSGRGSAQERLRFLGG
jgi:hypothetical protein